MTLAQRMMEAQERLHPNQTINNLRAENDRLRTAIETVLSTFEKDEEQGYRSKDRQYAIAILRLAIPRS